MAVAVEIDGVFDVVRRHELGEPHGAGPGAGHVGELDLSLVQNFQRLQELVEEFFLALAEIGLRRQHADGVALVAGATVIGFAAEDGEHDGWRHAELLFDCRERVVILIEQFSASPGEIVERRFFQIVRRRQHEFRLRTRRPFRPARQNEFGQRQIRLEPARRHIEGRARHAKRLRLRPQRLQPGLECRIGEDRRRQAREQKNYCGSKGRAVRTCELPLPRGERVG